MKAFVLLSLLLPLTPQETPDPPAEDPKGVTLHTPAAEPGYTLFQPLNHKTTYLVDLAGEVVHRWQGDHAPGQSNYLLDDGTLLRACKDSEGPFRAGGAGGRIQRVAADGSLLWDYDLASDQRCQHHDIEPLPNGNVLALCWEARSREEAIANGRDPEHLEDSLWSEVILELKPIGDSSAEVVWRWDLFDHLVQDRFPDKGNFGKVEDHPHRIDINALIERPAQSDAALEALAALGYSGDEEEEEDEEEARRSRRRANRADWIHLNSIDVDPAMSRLVVSSRTLGEVWVIPYGTSTSEASGRAGDLVGRFGNPRTWQPDSTAPKLLFAPHDARWIEGPDGAVHVMVYNNGERRPGGNRSSVDEYRLAGWSSELVWSYGTGAGHEEFFSPIVSGATRLANGNTLICAGTTGRILEVNAAGELVWSFRNPFPDDAGGGFGGRPPRRPRGGGDRPERGRRGRDNPPFMREGSLVRAERYGPEHSGIEALLAQR